MNAANTGVREMLAILDAHKCPVTWWYTTDGPAIVRFDSSKALQPMALREALYRLRPEGVVWEDTVGSTKKWYEDVSPTVPRLTAFVAGARVGKSYWANFLKDPMSTAKFRREYLCEFNLGEIKMDKSKLRSVLPLMQAWVDGRDLQWRYLNGAIDWQDLRDGETPEWSNSRIEYRKKPKEEARWINVWAGDANTKPTVQQTVYFSKAEAERGALMGAQQQQVRVVIEVPE